MNVYEKDNTVILEDISDETESGEDLHDKWEKAIQALGVITESKDPR